MPGKGYRGFFPPEFGLPVVFPRLANRKQKVEHVFLLVWPSGQVIAMPGLSGVGEMAGGVAALSRMREEGTVPSKTGCCEISSAVV